MGSRLDEAAGSGVRDWTRRTPWRWRRGSSASSRAFCRTATETKSRMSYNQTDERMKEQILLEALIVHIVEPNPSYCDHSVHRA